MRALLPALALLSTGLAQEESPAVHSGWGGARTQMFWGDFDRDGNQDVWVTNGRGPGRLMRNSGGGRFEDVTAISGLAGVTDAHLGAWSDVDDDGRLDLYVASFSGESRLYLQEQNGSFVDATDTCGLPRHAAPLHAEWFDVDSDGLLDLHLITVHDELVYRNLGSGEFAKIPLDLEPRSISIVGPIPGAEREELPLNPRDADAAPTPATRSTSANAFQPTRRPDSEMQGATCADAVLDQANGTDCIGASSIPTLGLLYPMTVALNVATNGDVGIGTTVPAARLDVAGDIAVGGTPVIDEDGHWVGSAAWPHDGGIGNEASGSLSYVGGGMDNSSASSRGTIGGGEGNSITETAHFATVGGGHLNSALGSDSSIAGGHANVASGSNAAIGGGRENQASGFSSSVSGGQSNTAGGGYGSIGGGLDNVASGTASTVSGGRENRATLQFTHVGGGLRNEASGNEATVGGGKDNTASGYRSTIGGGWENKTSFGFSTVSGGWSNEAAANSATIGGGEGNRAMQEHSTVAGGVFNLAAGRESTIAGGFSNQTEGEGSFVGGGNDNLAAGEKSAVCGGNDNVATGIESAIGGGNENAVSAFRGTVAGGEENTVSGARGSIGGGHLNSIAELATEATIAGGQMNAVAAEGAGAAIGGGHSNKALAECAAIGGGRDNSVAGVQATIAGGHKNAAGGLRAVIGGGDQNRASGECGTVPGGLRNVASGDHSFAAGRLAMAQHKGSFVWGDSVSTTFKPSVQPDDFSVYASGGARFFTHQMMVPTIVFDGEGRVGIGTSNPSEALHVDGNICATGSIGSCSDARFKKNVEPIVNALDKVLELRGVHYDWKTEEFPERGFTTDSQVGFLAQDVAEVLPEAVTRGSDGYYAVSYGKLSPLLVEALRSQQEEITALRARVEALEDLAAEVDALKAAISGLSKAD